MPKALDLTDQRFGRLIALEKAPSRNKKTYWKILLFDVSDCIDKLTETKDGENIWNVNYIKTIEELKVAGTPCVISISKTNDIFKVFLETKGANETETWLKNIIEK